MSTARDYVILPGSSQVIAQENLSRSFLSVLNRGDPDDAEKSVVVDIMIGGSLFSLRRFEAFEWRIDTPKKQVYCKACTGKVSVRIFER